MLKAVRERALPIFWPVLMGCMLSLGMLLPGLYALSLDGMGTAVLSCLFTALVCTAIAIPKPSKRYRRIAKIAGAVVLFLFIVMTGVLGQLGGLVGALAHLVGGNIEPLRLYAKEISVLLGVILTVTGYNVSKQSAGFYPALSMMMVTFLLVWFSGNRGQLWLFIPGLVVICALFARITNEETPYGRVLLVSLVTVMIALGVTPFLSVPSQRMEKFADRLRNYIIDTLFFTEPRTVYSLQVDGYIPLDTRLGGPTEIIDRPVMMVETPRKVYLRGTILNNYTGLSWNDTLSTRRYLYSDPRHRGIRNDTMDEKRPDAKFRIGTLFDTMRVHVTMQSTSASTLFTPLRMQNLETPMELVPYFNTSSEMFVTRDLQVGDTYTFEVADIYPYDPDLPEVLSNAALEGERRDMSDYLYLPDVISQDVYALTYAIIANKISPLDKARAIQTYLSTTFLYTLQPDMPPHNYDFVSYFLLRGKEGYCTYFASAMAVMGRIAGLPTRFVEGYVAHPSGGIALVTSKNAHAWAEVYFDGFGWIPFDATPAEGIGGGGQEDQNDDQTQQNNENNENTEQQNEENTQESNEQNETPSGDGQEQNENQEQDGQDPQGDQNQAEEQPDDVAVNAQRKGGGGWLWLLVLLLAAVIAVRWLWTRTETVLIVHCRNDKERLLAWYKSILGMLAVAGMGIKPFETPVAHVMRVEAYLPKDCKLQEVADAVTHLGYGRFGTASAAQIIEARACYKSIWRKIPLKAKALCFYQRMLHGIGNVRQVP